MPAPQRGRRSRRRHVVAGAAQEITYGVAGSDGRFQVFALRAVHRAPLGHRRQGRRRRAGDARRVWVPVYPGADWHERECWEMYGIVFDGHPSLRHLYLPSEFEGHPLRKDFPLLVTRGEAVARPRRRRAHARTKTRPRDGEAAAARRRHGVSTTDIPRRCPTFEVDPRALRHLADAAGGRRARHRRHDPQPRAAAPRDPRHAAPRRAPRRRARAHGRPGHRLHAPRLREAHRVPHVPADHHADQPHRLAVELRQRGAVHRRAPSCSWASRRRRAPLYIRTILTEL